MAAGGEILDVIHVRSREIEDEEVSEGEYDVEAIRAHRVDEQVGAIQIIFSLTSLNALGTVLLSHQVAWLR